VEDNYVYIHNAFRNHLEHIIQLSARNSPKAKSELEKWWEILQVHTKVEDEIFMPALESRGFSVPDFIHEGHERLATTIPRVMEKVPGPEAGAALQELKDALMQHLDEEEDAIMLAMVNTFSVDELWALDSLIVNPKLDYCPKDLLVKITIWWFGNISWGEGWALLKNFRTAGSAGKLPSDQWQKLVAGIPALQGLSLEEVAGDKLLEGKSPVSVNREGDAVDPTPNTKDAADVKDVERQEDDINV